MSDEVVARAPFLRWCIVAPNETCASQFIARTAKHTEKYVGLLSPTPFRVGTKMLAPRLLKEWPGRGLHPQLVVPSPTGTGAHTSTSAAVTSAGDAATTTTKSVGCAEERKQPQAAAAPQPPQPPSLPGASAIVRTKGERVEGVDSKGNKYVYYRKARGQKQRKHKLGPVPTYHTLVVVLRNTSQVAQLQRAVGTGSVHVVGVEDADHGGVEEWKTLLRQVAKQFKLRWINWVPLGSGRIALWHRPVNRDLTQAKSGGCTTVVTLQAARESAEQLGKTVRSKGMEWVWCELDGANRTLLCRPEVEKRLVKAATACVEALHAGHSLFIHCAAGMHRTGVFAYLLARSMGLTPQSSLNLLLNTRPITRQNVGDWRIALSEEVFTRHADKLLQMTTMAKTDGDGTPTAAPASDGSVSAVDVTAHQSGGGVGSDGGDGGQRSGAGGHAGAGAAEEHADMSRTAAAAGEDIPASAVGVVTVEDGDDATTVTTQ